MEEDQELKLTVYEYNGSTWDQVNNLNTARMAIKGAGSQTAAVGFGGGYPVSNMNLTEEYNGTSWATTSNLATSRTQLGSAGTAAAALCIGGKSTTAATEEFTGASTQ